MRHFHNKLQSCDASKAFDAVNLVRALKTFCFKREFRLLVYSNTMADDVKSGFSSSVSAKTVKRKVQLSKISLSLVQQVILAKSMLLLLPLLLILFLSVLLLLYKL